MRARLRLPDLDVPRPWRLAALISAGVIAAGPAAWMAGTEEEPVVVHASAPALSAPADHPLRAELLRCQALGEAGARDVACLAAWAESRRRFLGGRPQPFQSPPTGTADTIQQTRHSGVSPQDE